MTGVAQACADLTAWLPAATQLTHIPDVNPQDGHAAPCSKPPYNAAIEHPLLDIHAGVRHLEQQLRLEVTGSVITRGGSDANTIRALAAIERLAAAADQAIAGQAARILDRLLTPILQHPAIDLDQPPRRLEAPCPRCQRPMLRYKVLEKKLACLGCQRTARLVFGEASGREFLAWDDGETTIAPEGSTT